MAMEEAIEQISTEDKKRTGKRGGAKPGRKVDPEARAIGAVSTALEALDDDAALRVIGYVAGRRALDLMATQ